MAAHLKHGHDPKRLSARTARGNNGHRMGSTVILIVTMLAMPAIVGCADNTISRWWWNETKGLNASHAQMRQTRNFINRQSRFKRVPQRHVAEAQIGITEIEANLDRARAAELEREAVRRERMAHVASSRQDAKSREQIKLAKITQFKRELTAKQSKLKADLSARMRNIEAEAEKNAKVRSALAKESKIKQEEIISQSEKAFSEANAQIAKLRSHRKEVEQGRIAAIDEMQGKVKAVRIRAKAHVAALRAEADAIAEQTAAQRAFLETQLEGIPQKIQAEVNQLLAQANSIEKESQARAAQFNTQADGLEEQVATNDYELKVTVAKAERDNAQSVFERESSKIKSENEQQVAEIDKLRAEAQAGIESAEAAHREKLAGLSAWFRQTKAQTVDTLLNKADRMEKVAREEFVKAESSARAKAMRETAQHQEKLSEVQMNTLIAQAQAEAANLRAEILDQIGQKTYFGKVGFDGKTDPAPELPLDIHSLPTVPTVVEVTPRIEPEHVAAYRSALALVVHQRSKANAQLHVLEATFSERKSEQEAVLAQQTAVGTEQLANAEAMKEQADAQQAEQLAKCISDLEVAKSKYNQAMVEAGAFRKETLAQATNLRARARAELSHGYAQALALKKEADVVRESEKSEIDNLKAELQINDQQGESAKNTLLAKADGIEKRENAVAEQITAQINTAKRSLAAELDKINQLIETKVAVADATHQEAQAKAEAIARQTEVKLKRTEAQDELAHAIAMAEIERMSDQLYMDRVKGQAEIDRRLAQAHAERAVSNAQNDAQMVAIRTDADIVSATVVAQRRIAKAREQAVKSLFKARIAEARSNKIRENTGLFLDKSFRRSSIESALARAKAARAETKRKLASLKKQRQSLKRASTKDWDPHLAKQRPPTIKMVSEDK